MAQYRTRYLDESHALTVQVEYFQLHMYGIFTCVTEDSRRIYSTASRVNHNHQKSHLQEQEDTGGFQVLFYLPDRSGSTLY